VEGGEMKEMKHSSLHVGGSQGEMMESKVSQDEDGDELNQISVLCVSVFQPQEAVSFEAWLKDNYDS